MDIVRGKAGTRRVLRECVKLWQVRSVKADEISELNHDNCKEQDT